MGKYFGTDGVRGIANTCLLYTSSASGFLRSELAHRMTLRYTPELVFVLDDSISYGVHINKLIEDLDIKHDEDEVPEDEDNI